MESLWPTEDAEIAQSDNTKPRRGPASAGRDGGSGGGSGGGGRLGGGGKTKGQDMWIYVFTPVIQFWCALIKNQRYA